MLWLRLFLFFTFSSSFTEMQHQLLSIGRMLHVQAIVAAPVSTLNKRLLRLRVAKQVLLHILSDLLQVGLGEECTVLIIHMLGERSDADASLAYRHEQIQYLLIVGQNVVLKNSKKAGKTCLPTFSIIHKVCFGTKT